jgi:UDP-GlcNAc3NAcA epimerase
MIVTVIGTRPQFIKAAAVSAALAQAGVEEQLIHTGQHFDDNMSRVFFDTLQIPQPKHLINIAATNRQQRFSEMTAGVAAYIKHTKPRALMVYGDSDSAPAGARAAVAAGVPVIHVEAGLRSGNLEMPEEVNRIETDRLSQYLCCPSQASVNRLQQEGVSGKAYNTGDVMFDALLRFLPVAMDKAVLSDSIKALAQQPFVLLTLHRPYNVDDAARLRMICEALAQLPVTIIWPLHPRTAAQLDKAWLGTNIVILPPAGYLEMLYLLRHCSRVMTDSGGLQKEACWMQKPCVALRTETEWHELVEAGYALLLPQINKESLLRSFTWQPQPFVTNPYGNGKAAHAIAAIIKNDILK